MTVQDLRSQVFFLISSTCFAVVHSQNLSVNSTRTYLHYMFCHQVEDKARLDSYS